MGRSHFHVWFLLLFVVTTASADSTENIVTKLPGYIGGNALPFTLKTGYVELDEGAQQYFYYFVESQGDPAKDPVLVWITGNSCSSLHALLYQFGPLLLQVDALQANGMPIIYDNPYSATKNLNILFLDGPLGTGFSYSSKYGPEYGSSDTKFANRAYNFIKEWLKRNPDFEKNDLYIGGDGYAGFNIPMIVKNVLDNEADNQINLAGYVLGNPGADRSLDFNMRIPFANRLGCIPDDLFERANEACNGDFSTYDKSNTVCRLLVRECEHLIENLNIAHILEASCGGSSQDHAQVNPPSNNILKMYPRTTLDDSTQVLEAQNPINYTVWCRKTFDAYAETWANDKKVKEIIGANEDATWVYCKTTERDLPPYPYVQDVDSVVDLHKDLTTRKTQSGKMLRVLVFSGDHDLDMPYLGTLRWIKKLEVPLSEPWRIWSVDNETAGYTMEYRHTTGYNLTFATVKGGGHVAAQYKVKECGDMMVKWFAGQPLGQDKDFIECANTRA